MPRKNVLIRKPAFQVPWRLLCPTCKEKVKAEHNAQLRRYKRDWAREYKKKKKLLNK